jgi:hypothetical protein
MSSPVTWNELGVFPLQDHGEDVEVDARHMLVGARVKEMDKDTKLVVWSREDDMGTVGDLHPWKYWQTKDRGERGMGSWAQAFPAVVLGGGGSRAAVTPSSPASRAGPGDSVPPGLRPVPGETNTDPGGGQESVTLLPIRRDDYKQDTRFAEREHKLPEDFDDVPEGTVGIAMAGMEETEQQDLFFPAAGSMKLIAVNWDRPPEMGTWVYDLDPYETPSKVRRARLQSIWRVVRMPRELRGLGSVGGPALALQGTRSEYDDLAGYLPVYSRLDRGGSQTTTPSGGGSAGPVSGAPNPNQGHGGLSGSPFGPGNLPGGSSSQPGYGKYPQGPPGSTERRYQQTN